MAVDGVGKPPIPGVSGPAASISNSERPAKAEFHIESPGGLSPTAKVSSVSSDLLDRVEAGQITQQQYLDIKSEQAVAHLVGHLPTEQIELIRATLRDQLSNDPLFERLVRQALAPTGQR
jgi:hypothetical protein